MQRNRCLTNDEESKLRRVMSRRADLFGRRDYAWFRLLLTTGARITEFSLLTVGDARMALKTKKLFIPAKNRKGQYADLTAHVRGEARDAMSDLLAVCAEMTEMPPAQLPDEYPLVLSRKHRGMSVRAYQQRMKVWASEAGVDAAISPHWLRHTLAMAYVEGSESASPLGTMVRLAGILGHKNPNSCLAYLSMSRTGVGDELERIFPSRKTLRRRDVRKVYQERMGA